MTALNKNHNYWLHAGQLYIHINTGFFEGLM